MVFPFRVGLAICFTVLGLEVLPAGPLSTRDNHGFRIPYLHGGIFNGNDSRPPIFNKSSVEVITSLAINIYRGPHTRFCIALLEA